MHTSIHFPIAKTNRFNARCTLAARSTKTTFHQISCAWEPRHREERPSLWRCVYIFTLGYFPFDILLLWLGCMHGQRFRLMKPNTCVHSESCAATHLSLNQQKSSRLVRGVKYFPSQKHLTPDERSSQCSWTASQENKNSGRTVKMHLGCDFLIYSLVGDFISLTFPGN